MPNATWWEVTWMSTIPIFFTSDQRSRQHLPGAISATSENHLEVGSVFSIGSPSRGDARCWANTSNSELGSKNGKSSGQGPQFDPLDGLEAPACGPRTAHGFLADGTRRRLRFACCGARGLRIIRISASGACVFLGFHLRYTCNGVCMASGPRMRGPGGF